MSDKKPSDSLISALVLKAKSGQEGEDTNALNTLKKLCEKHGLDFEQIMSEESLTEEFRADFKRGQFKLMQQVLARYALTKEHKGFRVNMQYRVVVFTTTRDKYIQVLHAYDVLSILWTKEKKKMEEAFYYGFLDKHNLYPQESLSDELPDDEMTPAEREARFRGMKIARDLEDANLNPRIGPNKLN